MDKVMEWLKAGSPAHWQYFAMGVWLIFEDWLPKTKIFQANSTLQLISNLLKGVLGKVPLIQKEEGKN